jgi:hypothetical protein
MAGPGPAPMPGPPGAPPGPPGAPPPGGPPIGGNGAPAAAGGPTVVCPQCNTTNNKNFKFCGTCGHPLANVPPTAPMPSPPVPAAGGAGGPQGTLVLIRPDGTEGESIQIANRGFVGREAMPQFSNDSYLSPRHASFHFGAGTLTVRDENSLNGIYVRIDREAPVEPEDKAIFRIGQEIVRLEMLPAAKRGADGVEPMGSPREGLVGRICLLTGRETTGNCYAIPSDGLHLGRERGDILFPDDGYVSGLHARIHSENGKVFLTDVGSSNGTFIRIKGDRKITSGSMLLMGQQLFRIEY